MLYKPPILVSFISGLLLLQPVWALAHKVTLLAYEENSVVYCESFYADGSPVVDGKITITLMGNSAVIEGTTNQHGMFHFERPSKADLHLTLETLMGHRDSIVLKDQISKQSALRQITSKPGFTEIMLGIGCVLGLFGLAAYALSKKKR